MPSERGRDALAGMLESAEAAREFIAGMEYADFAADRRTLYAVTRCLEIISEASRRVDEDTRLRHPHIPWRDIADAGNVYRHSYESVAPRLVWRTVIERMSEILTMCRAELS